jgi:adenylate kinase family enzyme
MSEGLPSSPRVIVVGTSAAGKSTFAAALASRLGVPRIEMDALAWDRNRQMKPQQRFVDLVHDATDGDPGSWTEITAW